MAQILSARLNKGEANNLGFRLQGGKDFGTPLVIQKVNIGSPAEKAGLLVGDSVIKINSTDVYNLRHKDAQDVIIRAGPSFEITIQRGGSTWKPSVTPLPKTAVDNSLSPVTKTSLAAKPQPSIGAIGTGHNLSAKPFSPQLNGAVNGGPKFVNKQYNSPLGLYSEESIAETLSAQAEVLSTGVLGVNFKKNEKNYDASSSAVFRMVQEADKEPREQEAEPDSGVVTIPLAMGGLRHVQAPENKPAPTPQLPPGQNICAECERLIVGVFVRIKEKNLHVECFKCATCGTSLKNVGYYNINQKLYCDVHAKLAARNNPPTPNLVPVTISPGGKAPVGTISAALASHPLPSTAAPLSPHLTSGNTTAQPFQSGSNFSSPRLFSSVNAPLSPTVNNYPTLPKISPAAASFTSPVSVSTSGRFSTIQSSGAFFKEKGRSIQNVIWPPPPDCKEPELPTATPLYFPPPTHIRVPISTYHQESVKEIVAVKEDTSLYRKKKENLSDKYLNSTSKNKIEELIETEELDKIAQNIEEKMSLCSTEVTDITEKQVAVEKIETATETQMLVESVLQQRPKSPPPINIQPKIEVETQPLISRSSELTRFSNEPRVVTRVCVCTNSCCNANTGELCESCPMRDLRRPKDYQKLKLKSVENPVPKRYGSPIITGVSVTINNPGKIKEAVGDLFTQIPDKKTTSALGSALEVAPKEPFTPISYSTKPVSLPEETKPYLPPERSIAQQSNSQASIKKPVKPDTPFVSALRIAPERPFTPVNMPTPVKEKKSKEDSILKDLPKPTQWMSMVSALTTAPERPYSPFITESSTMKQAIETEIHVEKMNKMKEEIMKRSVHNDAILPKPFIKPKQMGKFEVVNNERIKPQMHFPPVTDELKSKCEYKVDYSELKREISNQIIEQAHLDERVLCKRQYNKEETKSCEFQSPKEEQECIKKNILKCHEICNQSNQQIKESVIEKQTEEAILKKPLELAGYLQKPEYLPQYQLSLNYDETIQLPHHKGIKKLLPNNQNKQVSKHIDPQFISNTQGQLKHTSSSKHQSTFSNKENKVITKPLTTIQSREFNSNIPQVAFQPLSENEIRHTLFSPRPGSITPSRINKPAPILPYYQENLVPIHLAPPEINVFDPKSPAISRSPSPCPDRVLSPLGSLFPRPVSPAPGPPPNPLTAGNPIRKLTKTDRKLEEAKKNISEYIPQYQEKVDGIELVQTKSEIASSIENQKRNTMVPSIDEYVQNTNLQSCSFQYVGKANVHMIDSTITVPVQQESGLTRNEVKTFSAEQKSTTKEEKKSACAEKQLTYKSSEFPVQKIEHSDIKESAVTGMHVTNPQPIISPFMIQRKVQAQSESPTNAQTFSPPKLQSQFKNQDIPLIFNNDKSNVKPTPSINKTTHRVSVNASTVSQPNAGSGGGRQAGAIGVAPKRGHGVLNVGGYIGARIPVCGHCHGQIRGETDRRGNGDSKYRRVFEAPIRR